MCWGGGEEEGVGQRHSRKLKVGMCGRVWYGDRHQGLHDKVNDLDRGEGAVLGYPSQSCCSQTLAAVPVGHATYLENTNCEKSSVLRCQILHLGERGVFVRKFRGTSRPVK